MTATAAIKQELELLVKQGEKIVAIEGAEELVRKGFKEKELAELAKEKANTAASYQKWYSQSLPVIRQLLPERYSEFQEYYRLDKRKEIDAATYTISDYLMGMTQKLYTDEQVFSSFTVFMRKFQNQIEILKSAFVRIDSILANIRGVLQAELFDDELSVANELFKKKHLRAAGAVAGVVIERHLGQMASVHAIAIRKRDPGISDFNDALKNAGILDVPN